LYVGARDGLYALDLHDGRPAWTFSTGREVEAAPVVSGGVVYAVCHDHHLYALDAASGRALWQHEMERRIEVPPVLATCGAPARACALVADRGGRLVAVERPLSASEHEAAGHWVEAASAYVESGQVARGAELLTAHGYAIEAAPLWKQAGELERAAEQYQVAGAWHEAAEIWASLERPHRQAEALEQHARALDPVAHGGEERAAAWESAAQVFKAEGEAERAFACQREAALIRRRPLIQVQVELPPAMSQERYCEIGFTLTNVGGGMARQVILRHTQSEFAGDLQASRELRNVSPGQSVQEVLSLRALASGQVPLEVSVTFADSAGRLYEVRHRTLMSVLEPGAVAPAGRGWNTEAIRKLLTAAFDDQEVKTLCFDHFPPVYEDLATGMSKGDMIQRLMEHCVRHEQVQELLELVERKNPIQYERFQSVLKS
jgi:tetratricopeptide (TPR) repeat protein